MSSGKNQTSNFHHYDGQRYYIPYQPVPSPPGGMGVQPYPPSQALPNPPPQPLPNPPSTNAHTKPLRPIKPAPPTTSVKDSSSPPTKKTSKSRKESSGEKEYKWVPYLPPDPVPSSPSPKPND